MTGLKSMRSAGTQLVDASSAPDRGGARGRSRRQVPTSPSPRPPRCARDRRPGAPALARTKRTAPFASRTQSALEGCRDGARPGTRRSDASRWSARARLWGWNCAGVPPSSRRRRRTRPPPDGPPSAATPSGLKTSRWRVTGSPFASVVSLKGTTSGSAASVRAAAAGAVGLDRNEAAGEGEGCEGREASASRSTWSRGDTRTLSRSTCPPQAPWTESGSRPPHARRPAPARRVSSGSSGAAQGSARRGARGSRHCRTSPGS